MGRKLRQNCTACGLVFNAEEKYLGKVVKCPQCKEPVSIVDEGPGSSSSSILNAAPPPAKSSSSSSLITAAAPAPKKKPGAPLPQAQAAAPAPRAALPKAAGPKAAVPKAAAPLAAAPKAVGASAAPGLNFGAGESGASTALRSRRKKSNSSTLIMVGMGGVGVVTILVFLGVVAFVSGAFSPTEVAEADTPNSMTTATTTVASTNPIGSSSSNTNRPTPRPAGNSSSGFATPGENWNVFVLNLGDRERGEVQVRIDGEMKEVPDLGPIMYSLSPGEHQLTLSRDGFDDIEYRFRMADNGRETYRPRWQLAGSETVASNFPKLGQDAPASNLDDWLQDFEAAKRKAANENKDILIAFNGSDWCIWCVRLMNEVLFQREFREQIEEDFVLVSIDSPRGREALSHVHDRGRNEALIERFAVSSYPTVILTDSQGQAYAEGGYVSGGVDPFMREIAELQKERDERDRLFAAVSSAQGEARVEAAEEALEWLRDGGFLQHYGPTLAQWLQLAKREDPNNAQGQYEVFFEMDWMCRLAAADRSDLGSLRPLFDRLEEFNKNCEFQDGDRGGRMNLIATAYMAMLDETDNAAKFAQAGLAAKPTDPDVLSKLRRATQALANSDVIGWGTGWVVANGGYIMTNYHVIEDGKPFISLPGREEPVAAKVIAKDRSMDIALLQVSDAKMDALKPLPISTARIGRGAPVGVFGYPLGDAVGVGLKLTTGIVSALADDANEGMYLLDCTVNPGNSGGPLCDTSGRVIGLVTAKSSADFNVDSYGMARPSGDLLAFLKEHLPSYQPAAVSDAELRWDQVDAAVSESVLMIMMKE